MKKRIVLLGLVASGFCTSPAIAGEQPAQKLQVTLHFIDLKDSDTLTMQLYSRFFPALEDAGKPGLTATRNQQGNYCFTIDHVSPIGYFSIQRSQGDGTAPDVLVPAHVFEAGDSVRIVITRRVAPLQAFYPADNYNYSYGGCGSAKYATWDRLDSLLTHSLEAPPDLIDPMGRVHDQWLPLKEKALRELALQRSSLPGLVADIFAADIRFADCGPFFYGIRDRLKITTTPADSLTHALTRHYLLSGAWDWERAGDQSDTALYWSKSFGYYAKAKWNFLSWLREGLANPDWIFSQLCAQYACPVRDRLILSFFLNNDALPRDMPACYLKAQQLVEDPYCKDALAFMQFKVSAAPAYDCTLMDSAGVVRRLSDFKGRPVLIDVWFTGCGGCASIYSSVLKEVESAADLRGRITFLSISLDKEREQWYRGVASGLYTSRGATNLYTQGLGLAHPFVKYYRINTFPTLILVNGKQEIVRYNSADLYNAASLRQLLSTVD